MGLYESAEATAAQERAWGRDQNTSVAKLHAQVLELRALLELLLKGEGAEAVVRMDRIATKFCFAEAGK